MTYSGRYVPTTAPEDEEEAAANQEAMRPKIEGYNVAPPEEPAAPTGADLMQQYGITNESVAAGMDNTERWLEENIYIPLGARLRNRSPEEERAWRLQQQGIVQAQGQRFQEQTEGSLPSEAARAVLGGGQDAIKSLGEFADLSGDSV